MSRMARRCGGAAEGAGGVAHAVSLYVRTRALRFEDIHVDATADAAEALGAGQRP